MSCPNMAMAEEYARYMARRWKESRCRERKTALAPRDASVLVFARRTKRRDRDGFDKTKPVRETGTRSCFCTANFTPSIATSKLRNVRRAGLPRDRALRCA